MNLSGFRQQGGSGLYMRERRFFFDPNNTFSWTVPAGVTKIFAFVIGAGGGGRAKGWNSDNDEVSGGGAGGGGYASGVIAVTPGATHTVTVGKGGKGQSGDQTSATAGSASSLGSFLTGNGGPVATQPSPDSNNTGATSYGNGGSASTSGVTEAYTAAGGGPSVGHRVSVGQMQGAGGGASSGSPFGPGCGKPQATVNHAMGGSGWGTGQYKDDDGRFLNEVSHNGAWGGGSSGGDGSHSMASNMFGGDSFSTTNYSNATKGGGGFTAKGGYPVIDGMNNSEDDSQNYARKTGTAAGNFGNRDQDGENANPNWWFPWEIDGGGGGAGINSHDDIYGFRQCYGGSGGPGAGGGGCAVYCYQNRMWGGEGGRGGFGGGGGGCNMAFAYGNSQTQRGANGGNGGIGGGGGGCLAKNTQSNATWYNYTAGSGGHGIVGIYW